MGGWGGGRWHEPSQAQVLPQHSVPPVTRHLGSPSLAVRWDLLLPVPIDCPCLQLPETQAEPRTLGASTPLRPPSVHQAGPCPLPGAGASSGLAGRGALPWHALGWPGAGGLAPAPPTRPPHGQGLARV